MSDRGTIVPTTVLPWLQSGKHGGPRSLYADTGLDCRLASTRLAAVEMHSRMPADGWRRRGPDRNQVNRKGQWPDRPGRRPPTNGSGRVATTGPSSAQSAQSAPRPHAFRQVSAHLTGVKREPLLNCVRVAAAERARRALRAAAQPASNIRSRDIPQQIEPSLDSATNAPCMDAGKGNRFPARPPGIADAICVPFLFATPPLPDRSGKAPARHVLQKATHRPSFR